MFYFSEINGQRRGPYTEQQLKILVAQGEITPTTPMETDSGHRGLAGQIKGLFSGSVNTENTQRRHYYYYANGERIGPIQGRELRQLVQEGKITREMILEDCEGRTSQAGNAGGLPFPETPVATPPPPAKPNPKSASSNATMKDRFQNKNTLEKWVLALSISWFLVAAGVIFTSGILKGISAVIVLLVSVLVVILSFKEKTTVIKEKVDAYKEQVAADYLERQQFGSSLFGEVLVSGSGPKITMRNIVTLWGMSLLLSALALGFFCSYLPNLIVENGKETVHGVTYFPNPNGTRNAVFVSGGVGGLIAFGLLVFAVVLTIRVTTMAKTEITVYEKGVTGKSVGKNFDLHTDFSLRDFQLEYDKIISVDTTDEEIVINASGTEYQCYVTNPVEIQRIIVGKLHKREV